MLLVATKTRNCRSRNLIDRLNVGGKYICKKGKTGILYE